MIRKFRKWHELKSNIENKSWFPLFREQEIWWCSLGANIGVEEDGKNILFERPILVLRKFNKEMLWALPMTSKKKAGKFYYSFPMHEQDRTVILSQLRVLSSKRLIRRIGKISDGQFNSLKNSLLSLFNLKENGSLTGSSGA